jgi:glycine cleavage system H protein
MVNLNELYYSGTHEYVRLEGEYGYVGLTDYAHNIIGEVDHLALPEVGKEFEAGEKIGMLTTKSNISTALTLPISGVVVAINEDVESKPSLLNDATSENWIVKVALIDEAELDNLMDIEEYKEKIAQ